MWIVTLDAMCRPILEWCPDGQTGQKKKTHVGAGAGGIRAHGDFEQDYYTY